MNICISSPAKRYRMFVSIDIDIFAEYIAPYLCPSEMEIISDANWACNRWFKRINRNTAVKKMLRRHATCHGEFDIRIHDRIKAVMSIARDEFNNLLTYVVKDVFSFGYSRDKMFPDISDTPIHLPLSL